MIPTQGEHTRASIDLLACVGDDPGLYQISDAIDEHLRVNAQIAHVRHHLSFTSQVVRLVQASSRCFLASCIPDSNAETG